MAIWGMGLMKILFENWRAFQLKEIFDSPVDEIQKLGETENAISWGFSVGGMPYEMMISRYTGREDFKSWEVEFYHKNSAKATNYGLKTGTKVMSTVLKILEDWIEENEDNFFVLASLSEGENRTKLYNRLMKVVAKKLGKNYAVGKSGTSWLDGQTLINIGFIERKVNNLVAQSEWNAARRAIATAIQILHEEGIKEGETTDRVVGIYNKIEDAQLGPKGE